MMRHLYRAGVLWLLLAVTSSPLRAQPQPVPDTLFRQGFEEGDVGGWTPMGPNAKLSLAHEPQNVKEGEAALRFDYEVAKDQMNAMLLAGNGPVPEMAAVKSFRFWIKADYACPIVLVLQEQNGGRYIYIFSTPKDVWQQVEVAPSEFILSEDADDPKDANNKLDLERVEAVALADMSQLFAQDENLAKVMDLRTGAHTLYADNLVVSTQALAGEADAAHGMLDSFIHPQPSWIATGAVELRMDTGMKGQPLKAEYRHSPDKFAAMVRRLERGKLAGTQWLSFDISSLKPVTLIVQVEERSGGKYNSTVTIPGNIQPFEAKLEWKNFTPADDSRDDNNRLDLEQVNQLLILDITGFLQLADGPNTIWLSRLQCGPVK